MTTEVTFEVACTCEFLDEVIQGQGRSQTLHDTIELKNYQIKLRIRRAPFTPMTEIAPLYSTPSGTPMGNKF